MFGLFASKKRGEKEAQRDLYRSVTGFILESLRVQMGMIERSGQRLPPAASDDYSLGYLAGYTESLAQFRSLGSPGDGRFALYGIVFAELFGQAEGQALFARFMKLQGAGDEAIAIGMKQGGEDLFAWLNGNKEAPDVWAAYVNRQEG